MKHVLVTGGAGFIGSNFIRYLLRADPTVRLVNLDLLTYAGALENLRDLPDVNRHKFVEGNICEGVLVAKLLRDEKIDTIVHFAAETHVDRSIVAPEQFIQTNVVGTYRLLEAAREAKGIRFHHISTDEVFGALGPSDPPFSETTPYAPTSPYAASKAASDHLVRAYAATYRLAVTISNCSNNYGPYQFPEKLVPLMILNALDGQPLPVYGDGLHVRDWLYVEDHCEAILLVLQRGGLGETYGIGGDNQPTNLDLVKQLCAILDELRPNSPHVPHAKLVKLVADRPGHDRRYAMDISKIRRELGWRPKHSLDDGLRRTVEWYLANPEWVNAIRRRKSYQQWLHQNYALRGD